MAEETPEQQLGYFESVVNAHMGSSASKASADAKLIAAAVSAASLRVTMAIDELRAQVAYSVDQMG